MLLSVYLDGLITKLKQQRRGLSGGKGCLAYAHYLTLISPSRKALQIMINICEGYTADYDVNLMVLNVAF